MSSENLEPGLPAEERSLDPPALLDPGALRQMFRPRIAARIAALRSALRRLSGSHSDGLGAVERQFHSLAGIGGTCGFPQISVMAGDAELRCRRAVEAARNISPADTKFLLQTVEVLDRLISGEASSRLLTEKVVGR